jgi:hypothetical protein
MELFQNIFHKSSRQVSPACINACFSFLVSYLQMQFSPIKCIFSPTKYIFSPTFCIFSPTKYIFSPTKCNLVRPKCICSPIKWWNHFNTYKKQEKKHALCLPAAPAGSYYALCLPGVLMQNIWKSDKMKFSPTKCNLVWHLYVTLLEFTNNLANANFKKSIFYL